MYLSRFQNRLLAYNPFAFHFSYGIVGIVNEPMPAVKLDGVVAVILYSNAISEDIMQLSRTGILRLVVGLYAHLNPLSDSCNNHSFIHFFDLKLSISFRNAKAALENSMDVKIAESWKEALKEEFEKEYFEKLAAFVRQEYKTQKVFPPGKEIFRAFDKCGLDEVRVVILGQDPYHGPGQANGLCFSVREGVPFPPSLINIFKEIKSDLGKDIPPHGSLDRWAEQGVLLHYAPLL